VESGSTTRKKETEERLEGHGLADMFSAWFSFSSSYLFALKEESIWCRIYRLLLRDYFQTDLSWKFLHQKKKE
jgi:hypothetical protein